MLSEDLHLIEFIIYTDILSHFDVVVLKTISKQVHVFLDEKKLVPEKYQSEKLHSKGFHP